MKSLLYITNVDLDHSFGYDQKIWGQIEVFSKEFNRIFLCYRHQDILTFKEVVSLTIVAEEKKYVTVIPILRDFLFFHHIKSLFVRKEFDVVYFRYPQSNLAHFDFLKAIKKMKAVKVFHEIPTYPYDEEFKGIKGRIIIGFDKLVRWKYHEFIDYIVMVSSDRNELYNIPVISIENGVRQQSIQCVEKVHEDVLKILFIGNLAPWHGLDIFVDNYVVSDKTSRIELQVVSPITEELERFKRKYSDRQGGMMISYCGSCYGSDLKQFFDWAHLGLGTLGFHRSGISRSSVLKLREYIVNGLPVIYSGTDQKLCDFRFGLALSIDTRERFDFSEVTKFYKRAMTEYHKHFHDEVSKLNISWDSCLKPLLMKMVANE